MDGEAVINSKLAQAIAELSKSERLGTNRFVRCVVEVDTSTNLEDITESWHALFRDLFGAEVLRSVISGDGQHALTSMTNWSGGQSAILVIGRAQDGSHPNTDLMIVGSRGAAYYRE